MTKSRDELGHAATAALHYFDTLKSQLEFSHEDMIHAIAAALAQMPEDDRKRFRAAFDQIEEEINGPRTDDTTGRLS